MSLIRVNLDCMALSAAPAEVIKATKKNFLTDMSLGRSGFFDEPEKTKWEFEIKHVQAALNNQIPEIDTFIHLGIGGSSLGAETIIRALAPVTAPTFYFFDNIDPDELWSIFERISPEKTLVYVVTKSGNTFETLAQFLFVYQWLEHHLGSKKAKQHLVFCTDPQSGALRQLASHWQIPTFEIPPNLGGRFSVLSPVGLFPAFIAGIDTKALLKGALEYRNYFLSEELPVVADLAYRLSHYHLKLQHNITVLMPYSQKLKSFSAWFSQLWAESLGKNGKGLTPISAVGATDQHSILQLLRDGPNDKVIGFIEICSFQQLIELKWRGPRIDAFELVSGITLNQLISAELNATRTVLTNKQRPNFSVILPKLCPHSLGQIFFFFELLTALSGTVLGVDPFDQPGVEEGKKLTKEWIQACKKNSMA